MTTHTGDRTKTARTSAVAIPTIFIAGVFVSLLAGETQVSGVDVRAIGLLATTFAAVLVLAAPQTATGPSVPARRVGWLWWFVAWTAWMALSSFWARDGARLSSNLADIAYLAAFTLASQVIIRRIPSRALRSMFYLAAATGVVFALGGLLIGAVTSQGRLTAFGGGPNVFVRIVGLGLVSLAAVVLMNTRRWPILVFVPVLLMAAILSGSRGGLVAIGFAGVAVVAVLLRYRSARTRVATMVGGAVLLIAFYFTAWPTVQPYIERRFVQETLQAGYTSGRSDIFAQSLELFRSNVGIGAGLDGYWAEYGWLAGYQHSHNLLAGTAAEGGAVGLAFLTAALIGGFRAAWRPKDDAATMATISALLIFVASLFSGSWYDSRFLWFYLILGAEIAYRSRRVDRPHQPPAEACCDQTSPRSQPLRRTAGKPRRNTTHRTLHQA